MSDIKMEFEKYLVTGGIRQNKSLANQRVISDYIKSIDVVCKEENMNWPTLAGNTTAIINKYRSGGEKQSIGRKNHKVISNALRAFSRFINSTTNNNDDAWQDIDPAALSLGVLDPEILEETLDATECETRDKIIRILKNLAILEG